MTDQNTQQTSEASAQSAPATRDEQDQHESTPETSDQRRDARTRTRLREVESERDRLRDALIPHVRAAVERSVADRLQDASSVWLLPDTDPLALLDEELAVDEQRVTLAVDRLLAHAPALARRHGSADGGARSTGPEGPTATWGGLLNGRS